MSSENTDHYFSEKPKSEFYLKKIKTVLRGMPFEFYASSGVFSKERIDPGTKLLIETMVVMDNWKVLDLGCGYGVIGIVAAKINPSGKIYMSDVNERALILARKNSEINKVSNVKIIKSDLFENIHEKFDTIITNPPYTKGKQFIKTLVEESYNYIKEKGVLQVVANKKFKYIEKFLYKVYNDVVLLSTKSNFFVYAGFKL